MGEETKLPGSGGQEPTIVEMTQEELASLWESSRMDGFNNSLY